MVERAIGGAQAVAADPGIADVLRAQYVDHAIVERVNGHDGDGTLIVGRVGRDMDMDAGKAAARQVGLTMLATIKANLGSLDRVKRVIKVLGMVGCEPEFERHPYVINGCSELFAAIWGEDNGVGVRSAVGMGSLPGNIPVEIEALFEIY